MSAEKDKPETPVKLIKVKRPKIDRRVKNYKALEGKNDLARYIEYLGSKKRPELPGLPWNVEWTQFTRYCHDVLIALDPSHKGITPKRIWIGENNFPWVSWAEVKRLNSRYPDLGLPEYFEGVLSQLEENVSPFLRIKNDFKKADTISIDDEKLLDFIANNAPFRKVEAVELTPQQWTQLGTLLAPYVEGELKILQKHTPSLSALASKDLTPVVGLLSLRVMEGIHLHWLTMNGKAFSDAFMRLMEFRNPDYMSRLEAIDCRDPRTVRASTDDNIRFDCKLCREKISNQSRQARHRGKKAAERGTRLLK